MVINCGQSIETKHKAKKKWHKWFAWYPVRVGENDCRWMETVLRKGEYNCGFTDYWWTWEYKPYNT